MADPAVQGRVTLSTDTFTPTRNLLNVGWRDKYRDALKKLCAESVHPLISQQLSDTLKANQSNPEQQGQDLRDVNPVAAHPAVAKAFEEPQPVANQAIPRESALGSLASTGASLLAKRLGMGRTSNAMNWLGPVASGAAAGVTNPAAVSQPDTAGITAHLKNVQLQQQAATAHEAARSGKPEDIQAYLKAEQAYRDDLRTQAGTEYSTGLDYRLDPRSTGTTNALWNAETGAQVAASLPPAEAAAKGAFLRRAILPYGLSTAVGAGVQALAGRNPSDIGENVVRSALPEAAAQGAYRMVAPSLSGARLAGLRGAGVAGFATSVPTAAMNIYDYANNMDEADRKGMLRQESEEAMHRGAFGRMYQPFRAAGKFLTGDLTGAANMTIAQEGESMDAAKMDAENRNKYVRPPVEAGDNRDHPEFSDPRNRMYTPNDTKRWMSNVLDDLPNVPSKYVTTLMSNALQDPKTLVHVSNVDGAVARTVRDAKREGVTIPPERIPELRRRIQVQELQKPENVEALNSLEERLQKLTGSRLTEKGAKDLTALVANVGANGAATSIEQSMLSSLGRGGYLANDLGWFEPIGRFAPYKEPPQQAKMRQDQEAQRAARAAYQAAHPDPRGVRKLF